MTVLSSSPEGFRLRPAARTSARESVVPMINVVFLLLIFLLLTAELAPHPSEDIVPPEASDPDAPPLQGDAILAVAADGSLSVGGAEGAAALAALEGVARIAIWADADLPAAALAELLPRLPAGAELTLATVPR